MLKKIKALSQNDSFMKYLKNSSWMLSEYMLRIISAIFVSIYIARYLGPEQFGVLSYILAIAAIFMAICRIGMESILVRDLTKFSNKAQQYKGTAFYLMLFAAVLGFIILSALIYTFEGDSQTRFYILIVALGLFFQSFLVIDYGFQAQVKAKYSSIAKSLALGVSSGIKIYLVLIEAELIAFVIIYAFYTVIIATMLLAMHFAQKQKNFFGCFDKSLVYPLIQSAWPLALAAVAFMLYGKADQLMIKVMLGSESLGIYAAAMKIFEGWSMVPFIVLISLFPAIVKSKQESVQAYEKKLTQILTGILWVTVLVAIIVTLFSDFIIHLTFGEQYSESAGVLSILMWAAIFTALGTFSARYLTVEKMEKKVVKIILAALIINIALNYILIPILGVKGAALATLLSMFFAYYAADFFDRELVQLRKIKNNSIFLGVKVFK